MNKELWTWWRVPNVCYNQVLNYSDGKKKLCLKICCPYEILSHHAIHQVLLQFSLSFILLLINRTKCIIFNCLFTMVVKNDMYNNLYPMDEL